MRGERNNRESRLRSSEPVSFHARSLGPVPASVRAGKFRTLLIRPMHDERKKNLASGQEFSLLDRVFTYLPAGLLMQLRVANRGPFAIDWLDFWGVLHTWIWQHPQSPFYTSSMSYEHIFLKGKSFTYFHWIRRILRLETTNQEKNSDIKIEVCFSKFKKIWKYFEKFWKKLDTNICK